MDKRGKTWGYIMHVKCMICGDMREVLTRNHIKTHINPDTGKGYTQEEYLMKFPEQIEVMYWSEMPGAESATKFTKYRKRAEKLRGGISNDREQLKAKG